MCEKASQTVAQTNQRHSDTNEISGSQKRCRRLVSKMKRLMLELLIHLSTLFGAISIFY
jgi:hypothetical protein